MNQYLNFSAIALVIIVLKFLRLQSGASKRIKFPNLWLMPVLFLAMVIQDYRTAPDLSAIGMASALICAALGFLVGLMRGRTLKYHRDQSSGDIYYQESYQSLLLYAAIIGAKWLIRQWATGPYVPMLSLSLIVFACGSLIGRCIFLSTRYLHHRASDAE
ncbi:MAG: hypothetical protein SOI66_04020 [Bifidobacterium sp.]|jgi:CDP-diglyceride synthetase